MPKRWFDFKSVWQRSHSCEKLNSRGTPVEKTQNESCFFSLCATKNKRSNTRHSIYTAATIWGTGCLNNRPPVCVHVCTSTQVQFFVGIMYFVFYTTSCTLCIRSNSSVCPSAPLLSQKKEERSAFLFPHSFVLGEIIGSSFIIGRDTKKKKEKNGEKGNKRAGRGETFFFTPPSRLGVGVQTKLHSTHIYIWRINEYTLYRPPHPLFSSWVSHIFFFFVLNSTKNYEGQG